MDDTNHEKRLRELERARIDQDRKIQSLLERISRLEMLLGQSRQTRETTF